MEATTKKHRIRVESATASLVYVVRAKTLREACARVLRRPDFTLAFYGERIDMRCEGVN